MIDADDRICLRCSGCVGICPKAALSLSEHGIECDPDRCIRCKICVDFCPAAALSLREKG